MPSTVIVHATVFAAGALLGGSIAAAISSKNAGTPRPQINTQPAIVGIDTAGRAKIVNDLAVTPSLPVALKHGNPGLCFSLESTMQFT